MSNKDRESLQVNVSVDCVVFGFDDQQLSVLLVQRQSAEDDKNDLKLPGNLIHDDEDVDDAAHRVLNELTGIKKMVLKQFKCFGSPHRSQNKDDVKWLENASSLKIGRLITVAYLSLCKINRRLNIVSKYKAVEWCGVNELPLMPFDHNQIVEEALVEIRRWISNEPSIAFELLPSKFTAAELRHLYEAVYRKKFDVRNFHKKIANMHYIVPLEQRQEGVSHRAARYYKFDKILYKQRITTIE